MALTLSDPVSAQKLVRKGREAEQLVGYWGGIAVATKGLPNSSLAVRPAVAILRAMNAQRLFFAVIACVCLTMIGCGGPRQNQTVVNAAGTDFGNLDKPQFTKQAQAIAKAIGHQYDPASADARTGPYSIVAVDGTHYVIWIDGGKSDTVQLAATNKMGQVVWSAPLVFGAGARVAKATIRSKSDLEAPVLFIDLAGVEVGSATQVLWCLPADGALLIRSQASDGSLANARLLQDHPGLATSPGDIAGDTRIERLAATVHLAGAQRKAERSTPAVRSHLNKLAGSTDIWLAQAAAELLTLPVE